MGPGSVSFPDHRGDENQPHVFYRKERKGRSKSKLHEAEGTDCNQPDIITLWRTFNISSWSLLYQESKENHYMREREDATSLDLNCKFSQAKTWVTFRQSVLLLPECMWPRLQEEPESHSTCLETTVALSHHGRSPAQQVFNPIVLMNFLPSLLGSYRHIGTGHSG